MPHRRLGRPERHAGPRQLRAEGVAQGVDVERVPAGENEDIDAVDGEEMGEGDEGE